MANIEIRGIVTREVRYGESSRILTVLSKDLGKVSVLASRARSNRSGVLTATQMFCYSDFEVFKGRENSLLRLNEGEVIEAFPNIRGSLDKMAYASYFCDITNHLCYEGTEQNELLRLLLNTLSRLEKDDGTDALRLESVFLFRALRESGFAPDCGGCASCGAVENIRLLCPADGVFYCKDCAGERAGYEVNDTLRRAAAYIIESELPAAFSFRLGENSQKYLTQIAEEYMTNQLEKQLKTLEYLRKVREL